MAFQPAPNVVQARVEQTLAGEEVNFILNFGGAGADPANPAELQFFADVLRNWWVDELSANLTSAIVLNGVTVRNLGSQDGPQATSSEAAPVPGTIGADPVPNNVAFCVTHRTALIGRSRRGRTYVAGFSRNEVANNLLAPARALAFVDAFNELRAVAASQGFVFCILSRFAGGQPRPAGVFVAVTGSVAVDNRVDSQRGRLD